MKKLTLALSLSLAATSAQATNITWSTEFTGPSALLSTAGALVPNDSVVVVGTLTVENDPSSFIEFGRSSIGTAGLFGNAKPGKFVGEVSNGARADGEFDNKPIYIWVYNATSGNLPADLAGRQGIEQGLFRSTLNFPANDEGGFGDDISLDPKANFAANASVNLPFLASQASNDPSGDNLTGNATGGRFVLGAVPEPSTGLLAAGALLLAARRRRK